MTLTTSASVEVIVVVDIYCTGIVEVVELISEHNQKLMKKENNTVQISQISVTELTNY